MKRNLLFIFAALLPLVASAEDAQELTVSDIEFIDEGYNDDPPMIILTKEGSALNVHLMNYSAHPDTEEFVITPKMSGGGDGEPCSVSIGVSYINHSETEVITTFNVSFNVHGIEANSFFFTCWWYDGMVNLTEGEPLTLESITEPVHVGEWYYTIDKVNHTAIVRGVDGETDDLTIPWFTYYEGEDYFVTGIDEAAFLNDKTLSSVNIPTNLTHIGYYAFAYCSNLKDVYCFADQVPTTGSDVFQGTPIASATLHVPAGLIDKYKATAPWNEFGNIVGEGNVTIDGLNYYLNSSFYTAPLTKGNNWEGELDIPSEVSFYEQTYTVTSMALTAFHGNSKLTKVRIPKSIENILRGYYSTNPYEDVPTGLVSPDHMNPFRGCTALESIEVDEENPSLKSVDGVLFSQDGKGYYYYLTNSYYGTGLYCYPAGARRESYTIPDGVEWISSEAFGHNQYISTLTIPSSMKMIYYSVFSGCSNLKNVYCYAENVPIAFSEAFKGFPVSSATLHVPAGSVDKYKATAPWSGFGNIVAIEEPAQEYFPEGTKWTEIRLDTLLYDSWYSKVGDEWVPNFETIEYYVKGDYLDRYEETPYKCVYSNGPEWADSLTLMILEDKYHTIAVTVPLFEKDNWGSFLHVLPGTAYQFDWNVGKGLYYRDIMESNSTGEYPYYLYYGVIDEIKEGDFGGVRPLKYVDLDGKAPYDPQNPGNTDTNGGRIIQGIGITEWNDGECLFGPPNPYFALTWSSGDRHYRSMLVHFERGGEVLYDVWPEKETATAVTYTKDQMATIILPTAPDAGKGKYYRLDKCEDGKIIFEQEKQPQAHIPYIIVPNEDFSIDPGTLDLAGLHPDTVSIGGIDFIGSYSREEPVCREGWYIDIIDTTPDCGFATLGETGKGAFIGALRAYLTVNWDDPYNPGGTKSPGEKMDVVLHDYGTNIASPLGETGVGASIYDLLGRRLSKIPSTGIYIVNGRKMVK